MFFGLRKAAFLTLTILRERANMNSYCRDKITNKYFECKPFIEDSDNPETVWNLRELGKTDYFAIKSSYFTEYYEACSPYEALSSIS